MSKVKLVSKLTIAIFLISLCFMNKTTAQESPKKKNKRAKITIQTNTYCDHCNKCGSCAGRIKSELTYIKGIKFVSYDDDEMMISVIYNEAKITIEQIRKEISKLGYDADDIPANQKAYQMLDACCKKE